MMSRMDIACFAAAVVFVTAGSAAETKPHPALDAPPQAQAPEADPVDAAVTRGIEYLISRQQPTGAICEPLQILPEMNQTAMTSLSIMALLAAGHQPADPTREGEALRRALAFVLRPDRVDSTGYFGEADDSAMYGHGVTTLMLAEILGMGMNDSQDRLIRERCRKAVDLILRSQKTPKSDPFMRGGWRYHPNSPDSDVSATVWLLMALRAAKNAELDVPGEAIDSAVGFIKRCYVSPRGADGQPLAKASYFAYVPGSPEIRAGTTAAGLLSLQMCGAYDCPEVAGSAAWLRSHPLKSTDTLFFYWIYYYAQGMHQRGGTLADEARAHVTHTLLPLQAKDGAWSGNKPYESAYGNVYPTSLAILALSVKYHFLPIYQQ